MKRKIKMLVWAVLLAAFVFLSINVLNGNTQNFNSAVYAGAEVFISPFLTGIMVFISGIGEWYTYFVLVMICLLIPKTTLSIGAPLAVTISFSAILNSMLKNLLAVPRPDIRRLIEINGFGYPSGHAMNGAVFFGLCAYLFVSFPNKKSYKVVFCTLSCLIVLLIGFSRIYLGVHTASDVLGGYLMGVFVVISAVFVIENVGDKFIGGR